MRKLLTTQELTDTVPDSATIDQSKFDAIIFQTELAFFRECGNGLGNEYYDALKADLTPIINALAWQKNVLYGAGDLVLYNGVYYRCTTNTTAPQYQDPTNKGYFELLPKFVTDANNVLYDNFIKTALSYLVMNNAVPMIATTITADGAVRHKGNGYDAADGAQRQEKRSIYVSFVNKTIDNMKTFILANATDYPLTELIKAQEANKCANNCATSKKNYKNDFFGFSI